MELDEPSKLLLKAAELIEERGWIQGRPAGPDGSLCAYLAICSAEGFGFDTVNLASARLLRAIGCVNIASWNDHPTRTKEEVIAKLREVAYAG